jgi:hypothetical protein
MRESKYKKLYWCYDPATHAHARPLIANSIYSARKNFATYFGYYTTDIEAIKIKRLPKQYQDQNLDIWPDDQVVKDCGIVIIHHGICSNDDLIKKLLSVSRRQFDLKKGRIFYFKDCKNKYVMQEIK